MTLQRILRAAVNDLRAGRIKPFCGADDSTQAARAAESEAENIDFAPGYAEPGYTDPERGILFANWNVFPQRLTDILERQGYEIEWSDEWVTCEDCNRAVRTSGNSYSWSPSYAFVYDCTFLCLDCIADDPTDYLETLSGNDRACLTESLARKIDLVDHGYARHNGEFEHGWYPGQTDDPKAIGAALRESGITDYIFVQTGQSQFYTKFSVYVRTEEATS
jgi:hypothetical protein